MDRRKGMENVTPYPQDDPDIEVPPATLLECLFPMPKASVDTKNEKMLPTFRLIQSYDKSNIRPVQHRASNVKTIPEEESRRRGDLFADEKGPVWHNITNAMVTPPIIAKNLYLQFKDLPIFGAPESRSQLEDYENKKLREFVGFDLDDAEFEELENYCDPENLKTGKEIKMGTSYPVTGLMSRNLQLEDDAGSDEGSEGGGMEGAGDRAEGSEDLCTLQRLRNRQKEDTHNIFAKLLKYRGVQQFPMKGLEERLLGREAQPPELQPGRDALYRVRVFRPFSDQVTGFNDKQVRGRHSVFNCDVLLPGQLPLTALREWFSCRNDADMRLDQSHDPDEPLAATAKEMFPSGFLFINNVFYVDGRAGCRDMSAPVRRWASERGLGDFPVRDMETHCLNDITVRLAYPEVYVHQGSCEHVFVFSEIRLVARGDPLHLAAYPCHTAKSQDQSIYCTTCAEFGAKWLVTGSNRVPFDPAFFCRVCFKHYLYKDGKKIGQFKAYPYKGNVINVKKFVSSGTHFLSTK